MAVNGQTLTLFAGALKRDYHGPIIDSLNNMTPLYRLLDKNEDVDVSGESFYAYVPIKTRRTQGIGARAEGGALPTARYTKTLQLAIPLAYNYGAIQFTGQAIKASEKSATSFAKVVDLEIKDMVDAIKIDTNRQFFNDGTGSLCMTNGTGTGSSSTVTVDTPGTEWLEEGMPIESFPDKTTGAAVVDEGISQGLTEATAHIVGSVLSDTTFQLNDYNDAEITSEKWATDQYIFRYGARANEAMGLKGIIDNEAKKATSSWFGDGTAVTTIHGQSRATYGILDATINHNNNTNTNITELRIQGLLDDIEKAAGKKDNESNLIFMTTYGVRKSYVDLLQADRRFVKPLELVGGWQAIAYQAGSKEIPMIVDRHCLPNALLAIDRRYVNIHRASNFDWMNMDGNMFQRKIDSNGRYDSYEAMLYAYMSLGCSSFRNQGALRDITEA